MQITETLNEGLRREIKIMVPVKELQQKLADRLENIQSRVRLNGFRPGRVPPAHLRKIYGKSAMIEIVNEILKDSTHSIPSDRNERSAAQPEIIMTEDKKEAEKVLEGKADFVFSMNYEILPKIEIKDISAMSVTREIVDISDKDIDEQVTHAVASTRSFETKKGKAKKGDRVTIDYLGKLNDIPFDGGSVKDAFLVIGSGQFIPEFEEQLIGLTAGDEKQIKASFPENYKLVHLAGKEATFDVNIREVAKPDKLKLDDETAKKLGVESMNRLRQLIHEKILNEYSFLARQKVKRQILDALDRDYKFEIPQKLVDAEFDNIWMQINADLQQAGRSFEDEETTEDAAREEYRGLAERRVRLGLVLSEIGEKAELKVTDDEVQRAFLEQMRRHPGQEKEVYEFFRKTPEAFASLHAPIFEEKVIDYLLTMIKVIDKQVSKEELMIEDTEDEDSKPAMKTLKA